MVRARQSLFRLAGVPRDPLPDLELPVGAEPDDGVLAEADYEERDDLPCSATI